MRAKRAQGSAGLFCHMDLLAHLCSLFACSLRCLLQQSARCACNGALSRTASGRDPACRYWVAGMRLGAHDGDWEHLTCRCVCAVTLAELPLLDAASTATPRRPAISRAHSLLAPCSLLAPAACELSIVLCRVHPETGDLIGIYFHAHRNHDGCWVTAPDVQRTADGRPIAYVALHGHGTYPVSGKVS